MQGATGSGRTWQRRSVATPPFFRPTRYPPSPTLPPAARLRAARAHARALAHRISVCALSALRPPSRRGSTAGEASRRRPGLRHLRRRLGETLAITSLYLGIPHPHSRSSLCAFRRSLRGHGRVPPWGSTRAAPILARPSTPASAPSSTYGNYPHRGLEPAARNPHPQQDCLQPSCSPTTFDCGGRD